MAAALGDECFYGRHHVFLELKTADETCPPGSTDCESRGIVRDTMRRYRINQIYTIDDIDELSLFA
jgi:hypothetical protein